MACVVDFPADLIFAQFFLKNIAKQNFRFHIVVRENEAELMAHGPNK